VVRGCLVGLNGPGGLGGSWFLFGGRWFVSGRSCRVSVASSVVGGSMVVACCRWFVVISLVSVIPVVRVSCSLFRGRWFRGYVGPLVSLVCGRGFHRRCFVEWWFRPLQRF